MHIKPTHKKMRMLHSSQLKKHTSVCVLVKQWLNTLAASLQIYCTYNEDHSQWKWY